jgi:hypothetical protein
MFPIVRAESLSTAEFNGGRTSADSAAAASVGEAIGLRFPWTVQCLAQGQAARFDVFSTARRARGAFLFLAAELDVRLPSAAAASGCQ